MSAINIKNKSASKNSRRCTCNHNSRACYFFILYTSDSSADEEKYLKLYQIYSLTVSFDSAFCLGGFLLYSCITASISPCSHNSKASAIFPTASATSSCSSAPKRCKTCLTTALLLWAGCPIPILKRGNSPVPKCYCTDLIPLCPPALPLRRTLTCPVGKSRSS